jgi:hypothetical protein
MAVAVLSDQNVSVSPSPAYPIEGGVWPFALMAGNNTVFADSLSELVGFVIPDYADIPLTEEGAVDAFFARVDAGAAFVAIAQGTMLAALNDEGVFVPENESEDVLTALLGARGTGLIDGLDFDGVWEHAIPLLLLSTDYAPFSDVAPITGNVQYFDPSDERVFVDSLAQLGLVELFVNADI